VGHQHTWHRRHFRYTKSVCVCVCVCVVQVDSLTVNPGPEGLPELMVSQPGCGYAILLCSWTQHDSSGSGEEAPPTSGR